MATYFVKLSNGHKGQAADKCDYINREGKYKSDTLRRNLSTKLVAERAGISRASLWKVESGNPSVAMGIYAAVLHALNNMDKDLLLVAKDDEMGKKLQDLELITRRRAIRRSK